MRCFHSKYSLFLLHCRINFYPCLYFLWGCRFFTFRNAAPSKNYHFLLKTHRSLSPSIWSHVILRIQGLVACRNLSYNFSKNSWAHCNSYWWLNTSSWSQNGLPIVSAFISWFKEHFDWVSSLLDWSVRSKIHFYKKSLKSTFWDHL